MVGGFVGWLCHWSALMVERERRITHNNNANDNIINNNRDFVERFQRLRILYSLNN